MYKFKYVECNEVFFFICRMVYVEVVFYKVVDWIIIKFVKSIIMLMELDILRWRIFFDGGLRRILKVKLSDKEYEIDEIELGFDFDGICVWRVLCGVVVEVIRIVLEVNCVVVNIVL